VIILLVSFNIYKSHNHKNTLYHASRSTHSSHGIWLGSCDITLYNNIQMKKLKCTYAVKKEVLGMRI
jgi:hypothetical protein